MRDENRTKKQLIDELKVLRQRVADSEGVGTERRQMEEALRLLVEGTTSTGGEFFSQLVRSLADALHVKFAFVSELADPDGSKLRLLSFWAGTELGETFEYATEDTPCKDVIDQGLAFYPDCVQECFPKDVWLREAGVKSYLAIPLVDSVGNPLGHMGVMHDQPLEGGALAESLLRIFAARAGSELERKLAEQALRESEQRFLLKIRERMLQQLANALPALIAFVDRDQRYQWVNDAYAEWFGLDPTQIADRAIRDVLGEKRYSSLLPGIETALRGETVHYQTDFVASTGSPHPVEMSLVPQYQVDGVVSGYFVIVFDISDRVNAQEADRLHQEALAHVSRVATIGELTASIAHELNQPLAAIVANAQAASRFLAVTPPDLGEIDDALGEIAGDAKRAGEVIRHMRDLLRKGEHREEIVDMNSLVTDTVAMLRSDALMRKVSVAVEFGKDLPPVSGDPIQLQQVVLNLMVNAFDAVSQGDSDPGMLVIRTSRSDGRVKISFTDNGPGFPNDISEDPFTPFVSSKPEGLGMGLSISRSIIEAHGGQLLAENKPDGGASLRIILPVDSGEEN